MLINVGFCSIIFRINLKKSLQINIAYVIITHAWICGVVANMSPCHGEDREFDPRQIRHGPIAQLVEQGTENPCVEGSTPPWATIYRKLHVPFGTCFFYIIINYKCNLVRTICTFIRTRSSF